MATGIAAEGTRRATFPVLAVTFSGKRELAFTINASRFVYGDFINALISFVIIAAVLFFFVIKPVNVLMARLRTEPPVDETVRACPECLSDIPVKARRCAFCTAQVTPQAP